MSKRFVILKNGGGELANQLWNYVSIYAYGLHAKASVRNPSFFEYHRYFRLWRTDGFLTRFLSFWFQGPVRRRAHPINQFWRRIYSVYVQAVMSLQPDSICSSENTENKVTYLPPSADFPAPSAKTLRFTGWLFRNPEGLRLYREQLLAAFAPAPRLTAHIDELAARVRIPERKLIGIHLRQGDYKIFKDGIYLLTAARMREVLDEYVQERGWTPADVQLFIASDGKVPEDAFAGYDTHISNEQAITDLFMLASTDALIGSNSSFGHFASWYGNIPHIVATQDPMDWDYYRGKETYFQNKYATLAPV